MQLKPTRCQGQPRQPLRVSRWRGVSMVEVLVAIVISAIALLALAGVNAAALRYTKMSQYRAVATQLANDMGERLRANKGSAALGAVAATGFMAGAYDFTTDFAGQAARATLPQQQCDTAASNCTPAEIAALDLAQWRRLVRDQLPEGSVFLLRQADQSAMDLWLVWRDPAVAAADEAPALTLECPDGLNRGGDAGVRCSYFRVNL
jgi:type IV pilus assembly protein PilV